MATTCATVHGRIHSYFSLNPVDSWSWNNFEAQFNGTNENGEANNEYLKQLKNISTHCDEGCYGKDVRKRAIELSEKRRVRTSSSNFSWKHRLL